MFRPRTPNLTEEVEETLKRELSYYWSRGDSAIKISEALGFGIEGGLYEKLQKYHVYYYRQKFKLPPRVVRKSGVSRYKVKPEDIDPPTYDELLATLDVVYVPDHPIKSLARKARMCRAYIWMHYYTPLRKSEVYERIISDLEIIQSETLGDYIYIDLYRKKKLAPKKSPFYLPINAPSASEIIEWLAERLTETNDKDALIFPISSWQSWDIVKKVFPDGYPHYWRFKYITDGASDPTVPIEDLLVETDLHILTLRKYMMTGERQRRLALRRRTQRIRGGT